MCVCFIAVKGHSFYTLLSEIKSLETKNTKKNANPDLVCASVISYVEFCGICSVLICSSLSLVWCPGRTVRRDCDISWVFSLIF